jgi:acyl-CoA synthetase (AMP-forming)/AMP-acid ligase II/thioesterase domain-containing protein/acyl carrier protein
MRENAGPGRATVRTFLESHAAARPASPAIVFSDRPPLTYGALALQAAASGAALRGAGIQRRGRVAIMMPDGPELALTIAAVACHAAAVPLNPNLTTAEFDSLFCTFRIDALVIPKRFDAAARGIATRHGVRVLEAAVNKSGLLDLASGTTSAVKPEAADDDHDDPDSLALVLRTSGTTARPKLVPVSHRNLVSMAMRQQHWFALTPQDRALCAVPLYYAHGVKSLLFTPLILGGSTACPERSTGLQILEWLADLEPTWFSAGPTFHQAILERIQAQGGAVPRHCLRFIQNGGAPMAAAVREGLEHAFGVPVLEAYGLSEAGVMAANSVAPEGRKPGTVGRPWPGALAVRADDGAVAPPGVAGEIIVRGSAVMPGYLEDANMNETAFVDGWFRTGDFGVIDADGFLTLAGRLKELINRGGEKIAPTEIDQALLRHPAVAEAAAFAVPHPRLGEDVSAAVVLCAGAHATSDELRRHLGTLLAPSKIPRRIHFVRALPKDESGKVRRAELAHLLLDPADNKRGLPPRRMLEHQIAEIWARLLERPSVGLTDDFFELGGDSLLATEMLLEIERLTGRRLDPDILFDAATVWQLTHHIASEEAAAQTRHLFPLQPRGDRPLLFFLDGNFEVGSYYTRRLAALLGDDQPLWVLRPLKAESNADYSFEERARAYLAMIKEGDFKGPIALGGYCNGGLIALELARQAEAAGLSVSVLIMIDSISVNARRPFWLLAWLAESVLRLFDREPARRQRRLGAFMSWVWKKARRIGQRVNAIFRGSGELASLPLDAGKYGSLYEELERRYQAQAKAYFRAMAAYLPRATRARLVCLTAHTNRRSWDYAGRVWKRIGSSLEVFVVPGDHATCVTTHIEALAERMRAALGVAGSSAGPR